jgi:hypothetical protein
LLVVILDKLMEFRNQKKMEFYEGLNEMFEIDLLDEETL